MGAGNVALVFARWGQLNSTPFRALIYMAHRSLDADRTPRFWGGREEIAFALGRQMPEGLDKESIRIRKATLEAVKEVMKVLRTAGAIRLVEAARPRKSAVYELILHPQMVGDQTPPVVGDQTPPVVGGEPAVGGVSDPPTGVEEDLGLSSGVAGGAFLGPAGYARTHEGDELNSKKKIGEFDYQGASGYLLLLDDEARTAVDAQARTELPNGTREEQIIRAAEIAIGRTAPETTS